MIPYQISVTELKRKLDAEDPVYLIDCREPAEYEMARIEVAELIPMNSTPQHLPAIKEMAVDRSVVVYCHHGVRSMTVVNWLRNQGIENAQSMEGGIEAWSILVDPNVPRY